MAYSNLGRVKKIEWGANMYEGLDQERGTGRSPPRTELLDLHKELNFYPSELIAAHSEERGPVNVSTPSS